MEKAGLPVVEAPPQDAFKTKSRPSLKPRWAVLMLVLCAYVFFYFQNPVNFTPESPHRQVSKSQCAQADPLFPPSSESDDLQKSYEYISTSSFRNASIKRLSGAVQVKSESFDDLGPIGEDPRWDVMYDFHAYLLLTFPLIHAHLKVEKVNTHGLLYTWEGSDSSLKPTLLMAHQDTVPVPPETIPTWTYPPWSGHYDSDGYIWGRGASDCKNQLIGLMETVELLLEANFAPRRTVLLSFGFDEECSGRQGAGSLAPFIEERYGKDGVAVIVDEGMGLAETWGTLFALPGTAEKGYTDVRITVRKPGGHSSVPQDHTSIGVLSELITLIEGDQYPTSLAEENPYYAQLQCGAAHAEDFPSKLKKLLSKRAKAELSWMGSSTCKKKSDKLALEAARIGGSYVKYLMQTSQAVDVIAGGAKTNALPERVSAIVNHRVNIGETSETVWDRLTSLAKDVAKKHNLTLHAFDAEDGTDEKPSSITLRATRSTLAVAPVTPLEDPFQILAGTTRALYGKEVIVSPGIMTGNTDTRYYWGLTKHIFRYGPGYDPEGDSGLGNIHTVDERVSVTSHVNLVKWFHLFLRNMDAADL